MEVPKSIEELVREKLGELDSLPTERRKEVLNQFHERLMKGGVYDLSVEELSTFITIFKKNGLNSQANGLKLAEGVIIRDPEEQYDDMVRIDEHKHFAIEIDSGRILSRGEMRLLAKLDANVVFDRLFYHYTPNGLGILPSYESRATRELEAELLKAMQTYQEIPNNKSLSALRKKLGARADITQLKQVGRDLFTHERRKVGAEEPTGGIEYKVIKAIPIDGSRFMPHHVDISDILLRFYIEEVARIAPEGANAFLDGAGILGSVIYGGMRSPIVEGNVLRPIDGQEGQYHIVPVKFFNVELGTSEKYMTDIEELPYYGGGRAFREVVKVRGQSEIVSRSDRISVISPV